jgi:hypothetical protein
MASLLNKLFQQVNKKRGRVKMTAIISKIKNHLFLLLILTNSLLFSTSNYRMSIEGIEVINDTKIEGSIYIENIGEEIEITSYQCALSINQNIDLSSLVFSYISGSSELINEPDLYVGIENIDGPIELTFVSYIGNDVISKKTLVGRFSLEGKVDISKIDSLNIQWDFEGTISTIITGHNFENITNPENHISIFPSIVKNNQAEKINIIGVIASSTSDTTTSPEKTIDGKGYNDGDSKARWATSPMPASLVFDLGKLNFISKTRFSFYKFDEQRIYQYSIRVSSDKINWVDVLNNVSSKEEEWSEENFEAIEGRYLELQFISSTNNPDQWANLWEAEIWGIESANSVEENEQTEEILPSEFGISQNYPNPFNPSTKVQVKMKENAAARLDVYNLLGERVLAVLDEELSAGIHEVNIDGTKLASGVYIYQLIVDNKFTQVKKMNLLK